MANTKNTKNNVAVNLKNNTVVARKAGRPAVVVNIPNKGSFTLKDLETINPTVKPITLRAHVVRGLEKGSLTKLVKTVKSGRKGKPAFRFMSTEALNEMKAKDSLKTKVKAVSRPAVALTA